MAASSPSISTRPGRRRGDDRHRAPGPRGAVITVPRSDNAWSYPVSRPEVIGACPALPDRGGRVRQGVPSRGSPLSITLPIGPRASSEDARPAIDAAPMHRASRHRIGGINPRVEPRSGRDDQRPVPGLDSARDLPPSMLGDRVGDVDRRSRHDATSPHRRHASGAVQSPVSQSSNTRRDGDLC